MSNQNILNNLEITLIKFYNSSEEIFKGEKEKAENFAHKMRLTMRL
jgi:hypothetical protein